MSNLVPTPRTDRNGRTVVRHMRPAVDPAFTKKKLPAATLPPAVPTMREIKHEFYRFLNDGTASGYPDSSSETNLVQWLNHSTDEQLNELLSVVKFVNTNRDSSDPAITNEIKVIRSLLNQTLNDTVHHRHAHDLLSYREVFMQGGRETLLDGGARAMYLGLRCNHHGKPLPDDEVLPREQFAAALRFSYAYTAACLTNATSYSAEFALDEIYVSANVDRPYASTTYSIMPYRNKALLDLVAREHDKVEKLVQLSIASRTCQPDRLAALLEYDGHSTLSSGAL